MTARVPLRPLRGGVNGVHEPFTPRLQAANTRAESLHFSASSLQWIVNAYTLVFGGFLFLGGRAADLFGRQLLFVAGVVVFTAASLLNGLATTSNVLIGGRALQGLGAALVSPAALSIVTTTFAEGRERTRALGVWSAIAAGGGAVGLVVGGFLTDVLSWRWVFFINLPIGIAAVLLALRYTTQQVGGALGLAGLSTLATSRTNHVVDSFGHPASIVEKIAAQVDGYQLAFTAGAFLMLAAGVVVLGLLRRSDVATIDAGDVATVQV